MSNVSLERYHFVLSYGALTSEMSKMALNAFCNETLQILSIAQVMQEAILLSNITFIIKTYMVRLFLKQLKGKS